MNIYKGRLLQKIFNSKIEARSVNAGHYIAFKHGISFATDLAANFGCNRFKIAQDIVSKLLRSAIWSCCAVWFESEQIPFLGQLRRFRPAALHRIRFGTCCFVPMSYFYSEGNEWSKDWAKWWPLLWLATASCHFHRNFHCTWKKKWLVKTRNLQSIKTVLTLELSQFCKSGSMFSSS